MKRHIYEFDEVVVGDGLAAILYCYLSGAKLFLLDKEIKNYEYLSTTFPLEKIFITKELTTLQTNLGKIEVANQKQAVSDVMSFSLSLAGQLPLSDKISNVRLEDNYTIKVITKNSRVFRY